MMMKFSWYALLIIFQNCRDPTWFVFFISQFRTDLTWNNWPVSYLAWCGGNIWLAGSRPVIGHRSSTRTRGQLVAVSQHRINSRKQPVASVTGQPVSVDEFVATDQEQGCSVRPPSPAAGAIRFEAAGEIANDDRIVDSNSDAGKSRPRQDHRRGRLRPSLRS